jgi:hypothetical protein
MPDELETILRLVAEGKLSAEEAAPIIAALEERRRHSAGDGPRAGLPPVAPSRPAGTGRRMRIQVTEAGRPVVDLRVPLVLAGLATDRVPGLSETSRNRIREALDRGLTGPILEVKDENDEVRIFVE